MQGFCSVFSFDKAEIKQERRIIAQLCESETLPCAPVCEHTHCIALSHCKCFCMHADYVPMGVQSWKFPNYINKAIPIYSYHTTKITIYEFPHPTGHWNSFYDWPCTAILIKCPVIFKSTLCCFTVPSLKLLKCKLARWNWKNTGLFFLHTHPDMSILNCQSSYNLNKIPHFLAQFFQNRPSGPIAT